MSLDILEISYLIASLTFILGLKMLSNPDSARKGNLIAAAGMLIAIIATITLYQDYDSAKLLNYGLIFLGLISRNCDRYHHGKKSPNDLYASDGLFLQRDGGCLCGLDCHH
jgi:NAD/NADP transhydrogenase beta subunit